MIGRFLPLLVLLLALPALAQAPEPAPVAQAPGTTVPAAPVPGPVQTAPAAPVPAPTSATPAPVPAPQATANPATANPAPAAPAQAVPVPVTTAPAASATAPAATVPEMGVLLDILRDDTRRAALIRALEATPSGVATDAADAATAAAADPASVPAEIVVGIAQRLGLFVNQTYASLSHAVELNAIGDWFTSLYSDERLQTMVLNLAWKLVLVIVGGFLIERILHLLLRRPHAMLEARSTTVEGPMLKLRRVPYLLGHLLLDLVPILGFGVFAVSIIDSYTLWPSNRLIMEAVTFVYMAARAVVAVGRLLFAPGYTRLRLVRCDDETAAYAMLWIRRLAFTGVLFFTMAETAMLFGLPQGAYEAIWRIGLLIMSILIAIVVLQNKALIAGTLDAPPLAEGDQPSASRRWMRAARTKLAQAWHVLVILWLLAAWAVWALEIERGMERLAEASLATIAIITGGKLIDEGMRRLLDRLFRISTELSGRYPGLETRANRYLPALRSLISMIITGAVLILLMEAWGLNSLAWFQHGRWGGRLVSAAATIAITLGVALVVWEAANTAIQRHLKNLPKDGSAARSARVRTLLPMLRTAIGVLLAVIVGLTVLTEIGINVAPLLAGAGVVGLAVGFGSQTLVRDVITGIFLLFEDAVAVGDSITVGGLSGTVEQLSIRSIRLRALDGSVHIVPFSAVTTVTNQTRDFGYAVVDVALDYSVDTDEAVMLLRQVGESMRDDEAWAPQLLAPLEVMGIDKMTDMGVFLRARIMTPPARRWAVGRELNRRIKQHCDANGMRLFSAKAPPAPPPPEPAPAPA